MPLSLVCTVRLTPLVVDVAVMVAPATAAPEGSITVPVIPPVSVCENKIAGAIDNRAAPQSKLLLKNFMCVFSPNALRQFGGLSFCFPRHAISHDEPNSYQLCR